MITMNSKDVTNPEEYKLLALVIAGTATTITLGGLFTYFIENRTRMESIEELRKARDAAEGASRAKSEFMSVLSHELRTPLTIKLGLIAKGIEMGLGDRFAGFQFTGGVAFELGQKTGIADYDCQRGAQFMAENAHEFGFRAAGAFCGVTCLT